jgi:mannosyltransferase
MITLPNYLLENHLKLRKSIGSYILSGERLGIILILLLGLLLRVYDLNTESIWVDELTSIELANSTLSQIIEDRSQSVNPPLYFIILHYWVHLFGDTEFSVRFPSVIFGAISLVMIYKTGEILADKGVGLLSEFLLALSAFHISYAQEARAYTLMTMLALISMYCFMRLLDSKKWVFLIGYLVSSILLMYTHFYGLFIVLAQGIYFLSLPLLSKGRLKLTFKQWLALQGLLIILYLPWLKILITQLLTIQNGYWIPAPMLWSLIESFLEYSNKSKKLLLCFLMLSFFSVLTFKGELYRKMPLQSLKNYLWNTRVSISRPTYLLILWLAVPILLPFVVSKFSTPIYYTRYTIIASLAFYILIAIGLKNLNSKYMTLVAFVFIVIISRGAIKGYYTYYYKAQWKEAAQYLDGQAQANDLLLFNEARQSSIFAYYSKRTDLILQGFDLDTRLITEKSEMSGANDLADLEPTVRGYQRVWLMLAKSNDSEGLIKHELSQSHNLSAHQTYPGIDLYLFEKVR